jgi:hypothetical protein
MALLRAQMVPAEGQVLESTATVVLSRHYVARDSKSYQPC